MTLQATFKRAPVTTLLVASFVALFVVQVLNGVNINEPSIRSLLEWGANALPYTMNDEPWRLVNSAFLHIGLMHLLFNAFAMYFLGQIAEVSFGSVNFLALFILSAIGGNLLNNYVTWWQIINASGVPNVSAGASGGIMGIGMAILIAATLRRLLFKSAQTKSNASQLKSLAILMGFNLIYGFAVPGIDNAGHIGGAITGAILGFCIVMSRYYPILKSAPTTTIKSGAKSDAASDARLNFRSNHRSDTTQFGFLKALPWVTFIVIAVIFYGLWVDLHQQLGL